MKMVRSFALLGAILCVAATPSDVHNVAFRQLNTAEDILSNGYVSETHRVTTVDGYILTMHRIPYGRNEASNTADRPVVFAMHGLLGSSQNFVFLGPEYSMGYHLADAGFDVWMGNYRGNQNSREHVTLNPDDSVERRQFFDFSFEEIGLYDIPAMIDYVLEYTGKQQLHYIGHSQGGTVFLVLASMRPEYNEKVASVHLLAGVGYQDFFPNVPLRIASQLTDTIYSVALMLGLVEIGPSLFEGLPITLPQGYTASDLCFGDPKYKPMCDLIGAREFMQYDNVSDGIPDAGFGGGSMKQIAHYGQNIRDRLFRRYHYGATTNFEIYGSVDPPIFDLGLITANVTMHYTVSDVLLDERDVLAMAADMPNTVARRVARDSFLHVDFIAATDAKEMVTDFIVESILEVHESSLSEPESEDIEDNVPPAPGLTDGATSAYFNKILFYLLVCVISVLYI